MEALNRTAMLSEDRDSERHSRVAKLMEPTKHSTKELETEGSSSITSGKTAEVEVEESRCKDRPKIGLSKVKIKE